ncbi:MAG: SH3 domain-containing protein [Geobacteraceae bacterium]|nr:SH3 domain-containing protein [Geobacteraceae bacterium]
MAIRYLAVLLLMGILGGVGPACLAAEPAKMRPYSGIGVVSFPASSANRDELPVHLYREPGLSRVGTLDSSKMSGNDWIFGNSTHGVRLIVMARKGDWLRVSYDDAGREAWIDPQRRGRFLPWDRFLKSHMSRMLPGLRKQYYQLFQQPERNPLVVLTPRHPFRVLRLDKEWAMVVSDQAGVGWLRWLDEDGRLTIGLDL